MEIHLVLPDTKISHEFFKELSDFMRRNPSITFFLRRSSGYKREKLLRLKLYNIICQAISAAYNPSLSFLCWKERISRTNYPDVTARMIDSSSSAMRINVDDQILTFDLRNSYANEIILESEIISGFLSQAPFITYSIIDNNGLNEIKHTFSISNLGSTIVMRNILTRSLFQIVEYNIKKSKENNSLFSSFSFLSNQSENLKNVSLRNLYLSLIAILKKIARKILLQQNYVWRIFYFDHTSVNPKLHEIENKKHSYYADPFLINNEGENYLFAEKYDLRTKKGKIVCFKEHDGNFINERDALEETFHLSFPFVFVEKNQIYMIPESSANKDIRIYVAKKFPYEWQLKKILINQINAVDSMVFKINDIFYLLTNVSLSGENHCDNFRIFTSKDLFDESFLELSSVELKIDGTLGRNAGYFLDERDNLIIVTQVPDFGIYGKSLRYFKIEFNQRELIRTELFLERRLKPTSAIGYHHLNRNGKFEVFDSSIYFKN